MKSVAGRGVPLFTFFLAVGLAAISGGPARGAFLRPPGQETCKWVELPVCVRQIKVRPAADGSVAPGGSSTAAVPAGLEARINAIWAPCCIRFKLTMGEPVFLDASQFTDGKLGVANSNGQEVTPTGGLLSLFETSNSPACLNLYFVADAAAGGLGNSDLKGAAKPGDNGAIVDDGVSGDIVAHEFGHNLGLDHSGVPGNLMGSGGETGGAVGGTALDKDRQCKTAFNRANKYLRQFAKPPKKK